MSIGKLKDKVQYLDRLNEDNFHLLTDNSDYSTIICGQEEAWWTNKFNDFELGEDLIKNYVDKYQNNNNLPDIKMILCGYDYPSIPSEKDYTGFTTPGVGIPWAERVQWPTYWFGFEASIDFRENLPMPIDIEPTKLISCFLNNGHKMHRVCLMQSMLDNGMMNKGIFRFCNSDSAWRTFISKVNQEREVGGPHMALLNNLLPHLNQLFSQKKWGIANTLGVGFDPDYHLGCIDIIGSSNVLCPTFCEKTARPLLFGKPFYMVGPPGINILLKELGFELYDEIFDYKLDNYVAHGSSRGDYKKYYDYMLRPLYDLDNTSECIEHIRTVTREKVLYNQKRIVDIIFDDSFIPYVFTDHLKDSHYAVAVQWSRKILAQSEYFSKYLSKEQVRLYSGK